MQEQEHLKARDDWFAISRRNLFGGDIPLRAVPSCQSVAYCQRFRVTTKWDLQTIQQSAGTSIFGIGCKGTSPWSRNLKLYCRQPATLENWRDTKENFPRNSNAACVAYLAENVDLRFWLGELWKALKNEFDCPYLAPPVLWELGAAICMNGDTWRKTWFHPSVWVQ